MRIAVQSEMGWMPCLCGSCSLTNVPNIGHVDILKDLNAMHEAEKTLNEKERVWYLQKMLQVRLCDGHGKTIACMRDELAFATAEQRCIAFLKVKGKYVEGGK